MRHNTKPNGVLFRSSRTKAMVHLLTLAFMLKGMPACAGLPSGWADQDIGSPALVGLASYTNGLWIVIGGGADIWNGSDQFNFCSNSLTGDGMIIARVLSQNGTDTFAQTGVMIRNDSTAGSPEASVLITPGNGVTFRYRFASGGSTAQSIT